MTRRTQLFYKAAMEVPLTIHMPVVYGVLGYSWLCTSTSTEIIFNIILLRNFTFMSPNQLCRHSVLTLQVDKLL
jgi:hypothetical protein